MAKLETAEQFKDLLRNGKYENEVNAKRAAGRTRLPDGEKKKAFAAIEAHFSSGGSPAPKKASAAPAAAKPAKKRQLKKKKAAGKKGAKLFLVPHISAEGDAAVAETQVPQTAKKPVAKKVAAKKNAGNAITPEGTLPISPSEVRTVADSLTLIDGTVTSALSVINALRIAEELNTAGSITEGVAAIKTALTNAAHLLNKNVVKPLASVSSPADPEVAARLEQVVSASNDVQGQTAMLAPPPPPLPQVYQQHAPNAEAQPS